MNSKFMRVFPARSILASGLIAMLLLQACDASRDNSLEVTASAYNSVAVQTNSLPEITASGHKLKPGQKVVAVSRDLLKDGLEFGTSIKIEGLEGEYVVQDTMAARWQKHIDIYMGKDVEAAREWGRQKVTIHW